MRSVYLAGGCHTPYIGKMHPDFIWKKHPDFGRRKNPDTEEYLRRIAALICDEFDIEGKHFDRGYVGNFVGELFDQQGHLGAMVAASLPGIEGRPIARLEGACASGGLAVAAGVDAIRAGADLVYVVGVEVQTTRSAKEGADYLARAAHYKRQRSLDPFTFPALFARRIQAVVEHTDTTLDDLARASVKAYANAGQNPFAHMRAVAMPFERAQTPSTSNPCFLENAELNPWLRMSDCSQVSDGASALVLASSDGLRKLNRRPDECLELLSCAVATLSIAADAEPLHLRSVEQAARRAYAEARLSPEQLDIAEVHDCFTVAEILSYEALGFAPIGQGARLLRDGDTAIDGRLPTNTGGGLVGFGHPVGATGVKQLVEIWRQAKGQCGAYQVQSQIRYGVAANMGGDDRTAVVTVLRNIV